MTLILFRGLEKLLGVLRNIIEETYPLSLKSYTLYVIIIQMMYLLYQIISFDNNSGSFALLLSWLSWLGVFRLNALTFR